MSLFSAYSVASGTSEAIAEAGKDKNVLPTPKPTSIGLLLADILDCAVPICQWSSLTFGTFIGRGTSMDVWRGMYGSRSVAIKRLRVDNFPQSLSSVDASNRRFIIQLKTAALEVRSMSLPTLQRCPNIVKLLAVSWNEEGPEWQRLLRPALMVEAAAEETPNLEELMKCQLERKDLGLKTELLNDILEGLQAIHNSGIVHGDIKPENVLVFHESSRARGYICKLSDFGFSQLDPDSELAAGGTPYWNAPECLDHAPAELLAFKTSSKRDVYSFGLLATYLISGEKPFGPDTAEDWPGKQAKVDKIKLDDGVSLHVREFVKQSIRLKPALKPKFDLDNPKALGETVQELNSKLARGELKFEVYDEPTKSWVDSQGSLPIGFLYFLSFTVCRGPEDRPSIPELRKFWGFSRYDLQFITWPVLNFESFPVQKTILDFKDLPPIQFFWVGKRRQQDLEGNDPFPHEYVPESMRAELFRHIKSEAENSNSDAVLQAFVSDWYSIGFGVEKNPHEAYAWSLKAAQAPARTPAAKFGLTVEVLRACEAGMGTLDNIVERRMLVECLSYLALLLNGNSEGSQLQQERERMFKEMIGSPDAISLETLRREFVHSRSFPRSSAPTEQPTSEQASLLETLELAEHLSSSHSQTLSELTDADLLALATTAISAHSSTALTHLVHFKPSLLQERNSNGLNLLQYAIDISDFFTAAVLSRIGADISSLFAHSFVRSICAWSSESSLAYLAQIAYRTASSVETNSAYDLRAAISSTTPVGPAPSTPGGAVPALHGAIQANNIRNVTTLLALQIDPPLDLETEMMGILTPLWMAAVMHAPLCVAALLAAGADAQAPIAGYGYAMRPLHYLCATGEEENDLIKVLDQLRETTEQSAPVETSYGRLDAVCKDVVRNEICSLMVHFGRVDVNAPDSNGMTPLMWCCKRGYLNTGKCLKKACEDRAEVFKRDAGSNLGLVDFTMIDNKGDSVLDYAESSGCSDVVNWCRDMM